MIPMGGTWLTIFALAVSSEAVQFVSELWPGEGIPILVAGVPQLPLRREPSVTAPAVKPVSLRIGSRVQFDQTRYQTIRSGLLIVRTATTILGRNLGSVTYLSEDEYYSDRFSTQTYQLRPGTEVELLQHRAEGTCFLRLGNQVIDAEECPAVGDSRFRYVREPEVLWWVRITVEGKTLGWALVDGHTLLEFGREF